MTWSLVTDYGLTGLDGLLIACANAWPGFTPLLLFTLFFMVLLASYFAGKRTSGDGNFPGAFFVASFFTTIITVYFSLVKQTVGTTTYRMLSGTAGNVTIGVVVAFFITSVIVLLMDNNN